MKKEENKVDKAIADLDARLIANGLKPTRPVNKEGTFVTVTIKMPKEKLNETKENNNSK